MSSPANGEALDPHGPVGWRPADRFDEWLRVPVPLESTHPRFDIRRARLAALLNCAGVVWGLRSTGGAPQNLPST